MNIPIIERNALAINGKQQDVENWLKPLVGNSKSNDNHQQQLAEFLEGHSKVKIIEPGISYQIINYSLKTDLEYKRIPSDKFQLIIYFYQLQFETTAYCKIDSTVLESNDVCYNIAVLTSSISNETLFFKKGTRVKGLSIQMDECWLNATIKDFQVYKNEMAKQKNCIIDFINAKQHKILTDIFDNAEFSQFPVLYAKSRVLRLTEQFLTHVFNRGLTNIPKYTNQKDFQALLNVEQLLLQKFNQQFPSIETLAKTALMSESKLKKLFKQAFGLAPYEYYQKNRMHKAMEMLRSRKHSVTQVGSLLGYQNMSNFSTAFKKEFDFLPSQSKELI